MPLFRRREPEPEPLTFTVGVGSHRVIVGGESSGCALLEDVDKYAAFLARTSTHHQIMSRANINPMIVNMKLTFLG